MAKIRNAKVEQQRKVNNGVAINKRVLDSRKIASKQAPLSRNIKGRIA